ncbi:hypothetical protein ACFQGT_04000 [Natrialbaceae archaeon GCM10025810]|uniref:DUF7344 domain-containing protein n=1 Tax=Halovalidus salilacus TaxID=3075124 RepID=UPI00361CB69A
MGTTDVSGNQTRGRSRDVLFRALSNSDRRAIIDIVRDRSPDGIEKAELAARFATVTADEPDGAASGDERDQARIALEHRHLPQLLDAGLLVETNSGAIETADHWAFEDSSVIDAITDRSAEVQSELDVLFGALADNRRRAMLSVLEPRAGERSVETLARDVAAYESSPSESVEPSDVERVEASLVHVHLPMLAHAGVIDFDVDANRISYADHPVLRREWLGADATTASTNAGDDRSSDRTGFDGSSRPSRPDDWRARIASTVAQLASSR